MAYAASLSRADKEFMANAARMDMIEAHESQMAEKQASRADVVDLAKTLAQDHSQDYGQIAELAAQKNVSIPRGIDAAKDPSIRRLTSLKGSQFDRQFANAEVTAQRNAIATFKRESEHGEDPELKAYAARTLPTLEKDLKQAESVVKPSGH
jgi:putative membrane protein